MVPGASLLKTLLLATFLRQGSVRDRALTSGERARLGPMIRRSANAPASALVPELGAGAIGRTGRAIFSARPMDWWRRIASDLGLG